MSNQINDGGPAFPVPSLAVGSGMTLRQYAAIKLAVPDSGLPWLDEMIVKSNRERLAAAALQGLMANPECNKTWDESDIAKFCYEISNEMLKAREVKP